MKPLLLAVVTLLAAVWPALAQNPPPSFETGKIVLYQPEEVLQARVPDPDGFANYVKQLHAVCARSFAAATAPETLDLVVAVRPGKRARVWFVSSVVPSADPEREPLRKELEAVPPCAVHNGPLVFAFAAKIAGGDGKDLARDKDPNPPIPKEWQDAAAGKEGVLVPDGFLDLVWPDPAPPAARPAATPPPPPPAPAAKPAVYIHVVKENDPQDQAARDTYASRYRLIDLKDTPAYARPKPIAGTLPTVARAASGEALTGHVLVEYIVTVEGHAAEPVVLRSADSRLDSTALKAMQTWRFEPAKLNGVPISTTAAQEFTFKRP